MLQPDRQKATLRPVMAKVSRMRPGTGEDMKIGSTALFAAAAIAAVAVSPANKAGGLIGVSAGVPPPGIYMFNQVFTYQANFSGPGVNSALGGNRRVGVQVANDDQGFLFVPGWTFLGATYDAVFVQPLYKPASAIPWHLLHCSSRAFTTATSCRLN